MAEGVLNPRSGIFVWLVTSIAAMVAGAFGPWAQMTGLARFLGLDADGWLVLGVALGAAWMLFLHARSPLLEPQRELGSTSGNDLVDPGWGVWFSAVGSGSLAIAAAVRARRGVPLPHGRVARASLIVGVIVVTAPLVAVSFASMYDDAAARFVPGDEIQTDDS